MIFVYSTTSTGSPNDRMFPNTVFIRSINRPGRLLNYWPLRLGAYSRWARNRGWALIKFSPFSASVVCLFCNKTTNGNTKRENVTNHGFCKILRGKFRLPGSLSVIHLLHFNFNLIVTHVNKWILWCYILDVRHRNVGNGLVASEADTAYLSLSGRGRGRGGEKGRGGVGAY